MLQTIKGWDQALFRWINRDLVNPFFDAVMPFMRESMHWAPLYLFLLVFVLMNFKVRGIWWAVLFICTVALTDMVGNYVFKHGFMRPRPCSDMAMQVRLLVDRCSGGYSFVSNHAANHFGMAAFFFVTFRHILGKWVWLGLAWAAVIAFAQVYVGVHYPLDVFCGALLGLAFGITTGSIFNKRFGFAIFDNQPTVSS